MPRRLSHATPVFVREAVPDRVKLLTGEEHIYENLAIDMGDGHDYENPDLYPTTQAPAVPKRASLSNCMSLSVCRCWSFSVPLAEDVHQFPW